jgi:hypothetical protein
MSASQFLKGCKELSFRMKYDIILRNQCNLMHTNRLYRLPSIPLLPQMVSYSENPGTGISKLSPGFSNAVNAISNAPEAPKQNQNVTISASSIHFCWCFLSFLSLFYCVVHLPLLSTTSLAVRGASGVV